MAEPLSPAEVASEEALNEMFTCLKSGQSFRLEAAAGAGKTYSLMKALRFLIETRARESTQHGHHVACITFTNVARDQIAAQVDRHPLIFCDTIHAFCWSLINGFQPRLRALVAQLPAWQERLQEAGGINSRTIDYNLGFRSVREHEVSLHHDDVIPLTIALMQNVKFQRLMTDRYPIILIDEYQDTDAGWVAALKEHFLGQPGSPLFGFFGDHWQKIYGEGCGEIEHPAVKEIAKKANFRSVPAIVNCLNRMRPQLPQFVKDPNATGRVQIFHTNSWIGTREKGQHWGGDLPRDEARKALKRVLATLRQDGWNIDSGDTKILMLTHRVLAAEQGYSGLPDIFKYSESYTKLEHPHLAFFCELLEPACEAFANRRFGEMFEALGTQVPPIRNLPDKQVWTEAMNALLALRENGTVGEILTHLRTVARPRLPDKVAELEAELRNYKPENTDDEMPRKLSEVDALHEVPYSEIRALRLYSLGFSPFETKHGVKGAQFENVLVVIGRGWNRYNFNEMLELASARSIPEKRREAFDRNRNLFYVACSRPKSQLALLFTQELSDEALGTLNHWFEADTIESVVF